MVEIIEEIKWGYPKNLDEAVSFFRDGYIPHGGGTTLIRSGLGAVYGLFNVSDISEMKRFFIDENDMVIGAGLTYSEVTERISEFDKGHLIVKALSHAASNPLRNRITLGGSINVFPYWSDALGPLIALGANLELADKSGSRRTVSIEEYIGNRELHRKTFIVSIKINREKVMSFYYREVRTHFDYPFFTLSLLIYPRSGDIRIVITGVKGRYKRLSELESFFREIMSAFWKEENGKQKYLNHFGENFSKLKRDVESMINAEFVTRQGVSAEYQRHVSGVVIRRGIWGMLLGVSSEERSLK